MEVFSSVTVTIRQIYRFEFIGKFIKSSLNLAKQIFTWQVLKYIGYIIRLNLTLYIT